MSARQPVVLLVARDGILHRILGALLENDCALVGARTATAAKQLVRQRRPDLVIVDDSFEDVDDLMAGLEEGAPRARLIVLATPNRPGTRVAHLAVFGPVVTKPFDNLRLRQLVLDTLRLAELASDGDPAAVDARAPAHRTTRIQGRRDPEG